jgi:dihydropteroate synthase
MRMRIRDRWVSLEKPVVMGIVNLSADSFSGDGVATVDEGLRRAEAQLAEGADWIDVGAESARTNREAISEEEEISRLVGFVRGWRAVGGAHVLSVNTWRPRVAERVLAEGGDVLNDIGGLPDDANARVCARGGAGLVVMHTVGAPKVRHTHVRHADVWETLDAFFDAKIAMVEAAGVAREQVLLDPGIDFAKQREDNLQVYAGLERLVARGLPVLVPVSRKTVVGEVLGLPVAAERDAGTMACVVRGAMAGARVFRVHNVRATVEVLRTVAGVMRASGEPYGPVAGEGSLGFIS